MSAMATAPPRTIPILPFAVRGGVKPGFAATHPARRPQAPGSAPTAKARTSVSAPINMFQDGRQTRRPDQPPAAQAKIAPKTKPPPTSSGRCTPR